MDIQRQIQSFVRWAPRELSSRLTIRASEAELAELKRNVELRLSFNHPLDPGTYIQSYLGVRIDHDPSLDPPFVDPGMA